MKPLGHLTPSVYIYSLKASCSADPCNITLVYQVTEMKRNFPIEPYMLFYISVMISNDLIRFANEMSNDLKTNASSGCQITSIVLP